MPLVTRLAPTTKETLTTREKPKVRKASNGRWMTFVTAGTGARIVLEGLNTDDRQSADLPTNGDEAGAPATPSIAAQQASAD